MSETDNFPVDEVYKNLEAIPDFETVERLSFEHPRPELFDLTSETPTWIKYTADVVGGGDARQVISLPANVELPTFIDVSQATECLVYGDGRFAWGALTVPILKTAAHLQAVRTLYIFE